jgi:adenosylcobinamide kinase / adenosylcobinamide-phosphate guanylyltransferase
MLIFISGGVRSGKSTFGERVAEKLALKQGGRKIYLATARIYDEEMRRRVERHRQNRAKKGYTTIEKEKKISEIAGVLKRNDTILLDCLGNLTANEMFGSELIEAKFNTEFTLAEKIFSDIQVVNGTAANLIVISNEIFSDGIEYESATEAYIEVLGRLHIKIAAASDIAVEAVFGSYHYHKGALL